MEFPVYIDGRETGTVSVTERADQIRVFLKLEDPGRVVRLTLFGETELYLGIPEPSDGFIVLDRRFTGAAREKFPCHPAYAAERRLFPTEPRTHVLWHGGKPYYF